MTIFRGRFALALGFATFFLSGEAYSATTVVDYSALAAAPWDTGDGNPGFESYEQVSDGFGSDANVTFSYRTLTVIGGFGSGSEAHPYVLFWDEPNYSGDYAVFSADSLDIMEVRVDAAPGTKITQLDIRLGSWPNVNIDQIDWRLYNNSFGVLDSDNDIVVPGAAGGILLSLLPNSTSAIFQFGFNWAVGINKIEVTTAPLSAVPLPAALVLFGTGVAGLLGFARRKRAT